ncbi:MAG: histidinol-phosphatase [Treponema sp.]|uniref:histidinol-phosphatase n=1 Tax=Treponema sp. TaxID=166 RepID=UPI003FA29C1D
MLSNFHTHTYLCKHAEGIPRDYVQKAAEVGCGALGFSDHCPYPHDDMWFYCRMAASELPYYIKLVDDAKQHAPFPVYLGFECEWSPQHRNWFQDELLGHCKADYLVLGSHWVPIHGRPEYIPMVAEKRYLRKYIDFTIEGMRSGLYAFLAHPDLFLSGQMELDAECLACADALIDAANDLGMPLEINGCGLIKPRIRRDYGEDYQYPVGAFWERAAKKNARIICNSDAHQIEQVLEGVRNGIRYAEGLEIPILDAAEALGFDHLTDEHR